MSWTALELRKWRVYSYTHKQVSLPVAVSQFFFCVNVSGFSEECRTLAGAEMSKALEDV